MITFFSGNVRSGKTAAVADGAIEFADEGGQVYANFSIFDKNGKGTWNKARNCWSGTPHPNVKNITPYDLVILMESPRREQRALIALQEVYGWFNSHKSSSGINDLEDTFVFQSGKLGYDWRVDSQLTMRVDGALRKLANARYECEFYEKQGVFLYHELNYKFSDKDIRTGNIFPIMLDYYVASVFDRYDTWERSMPIGIEESKLAMQKTEPELMDATIQEQTELLMKRRLEFGIQHFTDVNQVAVTDALIQLHLPIGFSAYVANRLKLIMKYRG